MLPKMDLEAFVGFIMTDCPEKLELTEFIDSDAPLSLRWSARQNPLYSLSTSSHGASLFIFSSLYFFALSVESPSSYEDSSL